MLPLITPLLLLQVGAGAYILNRIVNPKGEEEDEKEEDEKEDDKVDVVTNRGGEYTNYQRRADADRIKIWKMIEIRRLEANGRLGMIRTNEANILEHTQTYSNAIKT